MTTPSSRVLVFGASGWIGSAISDALVAAGFGVTGVFRSVPPDTLSARGISSVHGDLSDIRPLLASITEHDAVVFASSAPSAITEHALRLLAESGSARALAFIGGSSIYGSTSASTPSAEDAPLAPPLPVSYLPTHEQLALEAAGRSFVFRGAPILYGRAGGATPSFLLFDAIQHGVARYVGSGSQRWSACHVDDFARLVARGLASSSQGGTFNAVTHDYSLGDVAGLVSARIGLAHDPISITRATASAEWGDFWADLLSSSLYLSSALAVATFAWQEGSPPFHEDIHNYPLPTTA
jgi:nucleoside-diphosphate-sugar epimerase